MNVTLAVNSHAPLGLEKRSLCGHALPMLMNNWIRGTSWQGNMAPISAACVTHE